MARSFFAWLRRLLPGMPNVILIILIMAAVPWPLTPGVFLVAPSYFGRNSELGCLAINAYRERATVEQWGAPEPIKPIRVLLTKYFNLVMILV